jgi:hypothetical protein
LPAASTSTQLPEVSALASTGTTSAHIGLFRKRDLLWGIQICRLTTSQSTNATGISTRGRVPRAHNGPLQSFFRLSPLSRFSTTWGICFSLKANPSCIKATGFVTVLPRSDPSVGSEIRKPLLNTRLSVRVRFDEPNYFSPNPASPVVDAIVPSAPAIASPDIPNSAIHFRTISFSSSGLGEPLWLARCVRCGTPPPVFSVSPENAHSRLTRRASRFTLFGLVAYVYCGG